MHCTHISEDQHPKARKMEGRFLGCILLINFIQSIFAYRPSPHNGEFTFLFSLNYSCGRHSLSCAFSTTPFLFLWLQSAHQQILTRFFFFRNLLSPSGRRTVFRRRAPCLLQHTHSGVWAVQLRGLRRKRQQLPVRCGVPENLPHYSECVSRAREPSARFTAYIWSLFSLNLF